MRVIRLLVLLVLTLVPGLAWANVSQSYFDGDTFGELLPRDSTQVRVIHETLTFDVQESLDTALVSAEYQLENTSDQPLSGEAAFAYLAHRQNKPADPEASIAIDGSPAPFRRVTDADFASDARKDLRDAWLNRLGHDAPLAWFVFHLDIPAHAQVRLVVSYQQSASVDRSLRVNTTYGFDYLLSPARHWAGFGTLDVIIHAPRGALVDLDGQVEKNGGEVKRHFDSLPESELRFGVSSRKGLWLGMERPMGYWMIVWAAQLMVVVILARLVGRAAGRTGGAKGGRVSKGLLGAFLGFLVSIVGFLVFWGFASLYPAGAFGFGYSGFFGMILTQMALAVLGAATGIVFALRRPPPVATSHTIG